MRHWRNTAERDAWRFQSSVHDFRRRRATDQRPIKRVLVADLHVSAAAARRWNFHAKNQIALVERIMRERIFPRAPVKLGHAHARLFSFAQHDGRGVERGENRGEAGHHRTDAGIAGEQTVVTVLAVARVAKVAIFLEANRVAMAEIPAARMLREVAANRGDVADLLRSDFGRGFVQAGKNFFDSVSYTHLRAHET